MASIRRKLTVWYTVAMGVSVLAFGTTLYLERKQSSLRELDERLALEGNLAAQYFANFQRELGRTLGEGETPTLLNAVGGYLDGIRDYVVVFDPDGAPIYRNNAVRNLRLAAPSEIFVASGGPVPSEVRFGVTRFSPNGEPIRYARVPLHGVWDQPASFFVAAPIGSVPFGPEQLLRGMLVIAPIFLLGGVVLGYVLADAALRPLKGMTDELEAITDGRSLHRRLAIPTNADELERLAHTLNGMLARLEQSFGGLRQFTADASHELKTPLMVVRIGIERALTHPRTPPESLEALDGVLAQINHMTEMVDSLLTLARVDEGSAGLAVEEVDLRELVSEAAETAGILGEQGGLTVRHEAPDQPVLLEVDRSRIRQLLLNLVTNAIKYTPSGGKVSLGLVDQGETVAIIVGDDGVGIAPGDLPHIFDRFYRADVSRDRSGDRPGTGLGLAITKWIAEAHGGTISVQSRVGRGTVFTVTLPRQAPSVERRASSAER